MASTAHKLEEEKKEYFDKPETLDDKIAALAQMILESKHFVVFTGAGISTSSGIADFRSGVNTVLPTGPGAWEKQATGKTGKPKLKIGMSSAIPSKSHMALVKLQQAGYLKFLVSQNVDGLHRKSGFPADKLAEVHGNRNLEICKNPKCNKEYLRDFRTRDALDVHDHKTKRNCENCGKVLYDTIVNFDESLPPKALEDGFSNCGEADLCLVLGSSLRVTPAADMPLQTVKKGGKLVIVNLQATPLDKYALRINGMIDTVMSKLMKILNLEIPKFILTRRIKVMRQATFKKSEVPPLIVRGVDEFGGTYTICKKIAVRFLDSQETLAGCLETDLIIPAKSSTKTGTMKVVLMFHGHLKEPSFAFEVNLKDLVDGKPKYFKFEFDPTVGEWDKFEEIKI